MYILYVMLVVNLSTDFEEVHGSFATIDECWEKATLIARSPKVFSVRCVLEPKDK